MPRIEAIVGRALRIILPGGRRVTIDDFKAEAGKVTCLYGSNGTGKSLVVGVLSGRSLPRTATLEGHLTAEWNGGVRELGRWPADQVVEHSYAAEVSVVFQRLGGTLFAMQERDDYGIAMEGAEGATLAERVDRLREVLDFLKQQTLFMRPGYQRSFAQTRLLELACAASTGQPVHVFDEPFQGLDIESVEVVRKLLGWLAAKRSIVVITAHTSEAGGGGSDFVPTAVEIKDETADGDDEFLTICEAVRGNLSNASTNSLLPNTDIVIKPKHSEHFTGCLRGLSDSQINWLIAKNGHGKSTVAAALGGLIKPGWGFWPLRYPDGFHLEMGDWPGRSIPNREVHVVLQDPYRSFIESRVSSDLPQTFVNIHESIWGGLKRMPTDFSFGQLRFLQLLLIPRNARLVILDEPLLGLSPRNRAHMLNFIRWLATSSRGVICTALDASEKCLGEIAIHI